MSQLRTILVVCLAVVCTPCAAGADRPNMRLEGQPNFRDLGGYKTKDGRRVKLGLVFRAGELPRLADSDVRKLQKLGIRTVVNFLTDTEIKSRGEVRLPQGVTTTRLPIAGGNVDGGGLAGAILEARQSADFSNVPVTLNEEIHRLLIHEATDQYAALLRELANSSKRPLVFHCSHGVHRTGTAAAVVLSVLGVPWETIRKDYLLSNEYRKEEVASRLRQLRQQAAKNQGVPPEQVDMTNIKAFYILEGAYIDASLDEAVKQYGSMENYIRQGLGINDELIRKLRDEFVE